MHAETRPQQTQLYIEALQEYSAEHFKHPSEMVNIVPLSDKNRLTSENIDEIVKVCNQDAIYGLLFNKILSGAAYESKNAEFFESWANDGWKKSSYFVFIIKTVTGSVVGAIDIKSNNPEIGEIGYWISSDYPGYMTNVVKGLVDIARKAGYHNLVAYTKLENDKSKGVLTRSGFQYTGPEKRENGSIADRFVLSLVP